MALSQLDGEFYCNGKKKTEQSEGEKGGVGQEK
ncbi:not available [Yersinia enterocolitica]|nr:not available [Yersinia enterocolitica]